MSKVNNDNIVCKDGFTIAANIMLNTYGEYENGNVGNGKIMVDFRHESEDGTENLHLQHATARKRVEDAQLEGLSEEEGRALFDASNHITFTNLNVTTPLGSYRASTYREHAEPRCEDFITAKAADYDHGFFVRALSEENQARLKSERMDLKAYLMRQGLSYREGEAVNNSPEIVIELADVRKGLNIPPEMAASYNQPIPGIAVIIPILDIHAKREIDQDEFVETIETAHQFQILVNMGQGFQPVFQEVVKDSFSTDIWKKITDSGLKLIV